MESLISIITSITILSGCIGSVYMMLLSHASRKYDLFKTQGFFEEESWTKTLTETILYVYWPNYRAKKEDIQELEDLRILINRRFVVFWINVVLTLGGILGIILFYRQ
ncbi:MAG: hypothetical protein JKY52_13500 [Flavobacteriales bacterium]|nr:hypothetical protein [Flavobacteriales bacterium]